MPKKMTNYVIKAKCMVCGLHFVAYSWNNEWTPVFCPECGQHEGAFMLWKEDTTLNIFELVPGATPLVAFDLPDANPSKRSEDERRCASLNPKSTQDDRCQRPRGHSGDHTGFCHSGGLVIYPSKWTDDELAVSSGV